MNHTTTHARWRVLPVHLVAKLFGVLIKVEGMPFGSSRTHLANPPRPEDITGSQAGYQFGACSSNAPPPDRDRDALVVILTQVICQASEAFGRTSPSSSAQAAAIAFRAGLDAFTAVPKPVTGDVAAPACAPSTPKSMAEKISTLGPHMDKAVEAEMESRERLRKLRL
ncbi:hypothetical protein [Janthinobacterium sp. RA13]|uniref:hypothetical protein n=1 Tax=Janthinobacterium sp. RA13 TaxID=1502762 RepID=UPI00055EEA88|nr:hypothetical protein [Janthinobacterium sp. RA13]